MMVSSPSTEHDSLRYSMGFPLRPSVTLAIPYVWISVFAVTLLAATAKFPFDDAPLRLITAGQLTAATVVNAVLVILLVADTRPIRRQPRGTRLAPFLGIVCSVLGVCAAQYGAVLAYSPALYR